MKTNYAKRFAIDSQQTQAARYQLGNVVRRFHEAVQRSCKYNVRSSDLHERKEIDHYIKITHIFISYV